MRIKFGKCISASGLACVMLLAAGPAKAKDLTDVVLGVSVVSMNSSLYTAAMELGYFEQEGLSVRFQEFQGGTVLTTQVATKAVPIGATPMDSLIIANQPGKTPIPVKYFYNQMRDYIYYMVVSPDSSYKTIADLKGKKIGVSSLTVAKGIPRLILSDAGLKEGNDYTFVPIGVGGPAFKALLDGQVDAYWTWDTNIAGFETQAGAVKLRSLEYNPRYKTLISQGFFAHVDTIKDNPKLLIGFGRAVAKATIFCQIAMDHCLKSYWKFRPQLAPREGTLEENVRRLVPALHVAWKTYLAFPPGMPRKFAEFPKASMENFIAVMADGGEIATKYDPSGLYTNELVDQINDFDVAMIEKQAQSVK